MILFSITGLFFRPTCFWAAPLERHTASGGSLGHLGGIFRTSPAKISFLLGRWRLGCVSYSLAVGVKMNILLFAPGLLLLLLQANGVVGTAVCLSICAAVQVRIVVQTLCGYCITPPLSVGLVSRWRISCVFVSLVFIIFLLGHKCDGHFVSTRTSRNTVPKRTRTLMYLQHIWSFLSLQLLLGAPFLLHHPVAYVARSFELGRVFKFQWTVNFKFLSEETFVSPVLSVVLLVLTVVTLALFATKWIRSSPTVPSVFNRRVGEILSVDDANRAEKVKTDWQLPSEYIVKTLFVSNFIGIVFCRSLHYQVKKE